jgi:hypothetical protein
MMSSPPPPHGKNQRTFSNGQNVVKFFYWDINLLSRLALISYEDTLYFANYISLYCEVIMYISAKIFNLLKYSMCTILPLQELRFCICANSVETVDAETRPVPDSE